MKPFKCSWFVLVMLTLSVGSGSAAAQTTSNRNNQLSRSRAELVKSTEEYKTITEEVLLLHEQEVNSASQEVEQLRQLVGEGLVARNELTASEQTLASAKAKLEAARQQIIDSVQLIAQLNGTNEAAKSQASAGGERSSPVRYRTFTDQTILRYKGSSPWFLANLSGVQTFFLTKFGRSLPISAKGQSATHDALGYDHRNAVDVALHPDSVEGKALISYLQNQGIPFLAFRSPIPGIATAAHIHIGNPSRRMA